MVSREMNDAKVYYEVKPGILVVLTFSLPVTTPMALGITSAVIFFSIRRTSVNGMTSCRQRKAARQRSRP